MLADLLSDGQLSITPLMSNAALDEYVARARSGDRLFPEDTRSATLMAPLLADSHTIEHALQSWQAKDFDSAYSWFWSVLRRQISLGLLDASKATKGHFASCLVDGMCSRKSYDVETLKMAVGLLIESENADGAKSIPWPDELLDSIVDESVCQHIIDRAETYTGTLKRRRAVAVILFSRWARNVGPARRGLAAKMIRYLLHIGSDQNADLRVDGADFQTCFSAVLEICERRPEFRNDIREELADILARRIGNIGYWTGEDVALRLAAECAPVFTEDGLKRVVRTVVALLDRLDPSEGSWVIARPAIRLLGEVNVAKLAEDDKALGSAILHAILKFNSIESGGTYAADILFSLNQYSPVLLHSSDIDEQYKPLVDQALNKASIINASNAVANIMALLVSPKVAGREVISRVLGILCRLIESAVSGNAALSFGQAYPPTAANLSP